MSNTVQLSAKTIQILANFASINSSILFKKGNVIKTISNAQNILAKAVVDETFPQDFAIYDLSQFLSAISLFNDPVLIFDNANYVTIRDSNRGRRSKYYFSNPEITMRNAPDREIKFPGGNINFEVSNANLKALLKLPLFTVCLTSLYGASKILSLFKPGTKKMTPATPMTKLSVVMPTTNIPWTLRWRT